MYTTNGETEALAELQLFEQARCFFLQKNGIAAGSGTPVRIIAFRSEQEYRPFQPNAGAFAYYEQARDGDYIVLSDIAPEHRAAAVHEYTHLILTHAGVKFPVWLNEGLADLYSSIKFRDGQAIIGAALPDRLYVLGRDQWLPLDALFAVDQNSPDYNQSDKAQIFYAESWALVHMLEFGAGYSQYSGRFLKNIAGGVPVTDALAAIFGKTPEQVYDDLQDYVQQRTIQTVAFSLPVHNQPLRAQVSEPSDLEIRLVLGDLLASNPSKMVQAQHVLGSISAEFPESAEAEVSLGYLAWQQHDPIRARSHFQAAVARGSKNAKMIADLAAIELSLGGSKAEALALLQKALALQPDDYEIRLHVGLLAASQKQPELGLSALSGLKQIKPADTFPVFMALAYLQIQRQDLPDAKSYAEKAMEYASRPDQRIAAQRIIDYATTR